MSIGQHRPLKTRGGIRCHGGVSIPCNPIVFMIKAIVSVNTPYYFTSMLTPPWHLIPPLVFRGPCCPMLTEFVYVFWTFLTILTLVSLILIYERNEVLSISNNFTLELSIFELKMYQSNYLS